MELCFAAEARRLPPAAGRRALAWLRRWRHSPARVFWEVTPTGEWRLI